MIEYFRRRDGLNMLGEKSTFNPNVDYRVAESRFTRRMLVWRSMTKHPLPDHWTLV